jgi:hypothetical protein
MEIVLNFIIIVICVFFNHTDGSIFFSHDFYILVPFDCTAGNCSEFDHDIMGSFLSHIWKLFRMKKSLKTNNYLPTSSLKRVNKFLNQSL